jgi:hypothetical protein
VVERIKEIVVSPQWLWNVGTAIISIVGALLIFTWQAAAVKTEFILAIKDVRTEIKEERDRNGRQDLSLEEHTKWLKGGMQLRQWTSSRVNYLEKMHKIDPPPMEQIP